jgi:hypothetical protein
VRPILGDSHARGSLVRADDVARLLGDQLERIVER